MTLILGRKGETSSEYFFSSKQTENFTNYLKTFFRHRKSSNMTAIPEKRKQKAELYNHPGFLPESNFRTTAKGQEKPRGAPQPH